MNWSAARGSLDNCAVFADSAVGPSGRSGDEFVARGHADDVQVLLGKAVCHLCRGNEVLALACWAYVVDVDRAHYASVFGVVRGSSKCHAGQ